MKASEHDYSIDKIPNIIKFGTIYEKEGVLYIDGFSINMNQSNLSSIEGSIRAIIARLEEELKKCIEPKIYKIEG